MPDLRAGREIAERDRVGALGGRGGVVGFAALLAVLLSSSADAQNVFLPTAPGDWWDPAAWSEGIVPGAGARVSIADGRDATASTTSPFYPGTGTPLDVEFLAIEGNGSSGGATESFFTVEGLDVVVRGQFQLGSRFEGVGGGSPAVGNAILGGDLYSPFLSIATASLGGGGPIGLPPAVEARLEIAGDLGPVLDADAPSDATSILLAQAPLGEATGLIEIAGDLVEGGTLSIAKAGIRSTSLLPFSSEEARATGTLRVGGELTGTLRVAESLGAGNARGTVEVEGAATGGVLIGLLEPGYDETVTGVKTPDGKQGGADGSVRVDALRTTGVTVGAATRIDDASVDLYDSRDRAIGLLRVSGEISSSLSSSYSLTAGTGRGASRVTGQVFAHGARDLSRVSVGQHESDYADAGESVGQLQISDFGLDFTAADSVGRPRGALEIGITRGVSGASIGTVDVVGSIGGGLDVVRVGIQEGAGGTARGILNLQEGKLTANRMDLALAEGGTATAEVQLFLSTVELTGALRLGEGASLRIVFESPDTSVLSVGSAELNGALILDLTNFRSEIAAGTVFEILRTTEEDGLQGDFTSLAIVGFDPGLVRLGIESVEEAGRIVEVYRATIVPEPGTALLVAGGLLGLACRRTRREGMGTPRHR